MDRFLNRIYIYIYSYICRKGIQHTENEITQHRQDKQDQTERTMHHNETHKRAVRHFMAFSVRRDKRPMSVCLSCLCLTVCLSISMSMSMSVCLSQSNCLSVYVYVCLQEHPYVVVRKGLLQFGPHSACSEADRVWFEAICSRLKAFEGFWSWSILSLSWSDLVRSDPTRFEAFWKINGSCRSNRSEQKCFEGWLTDWL